MEQAVGVVPVDRDVVKFFKAMGAGYGPRMNTILRAFMQARLSGLIEHGDLAGEYREDWMGKERPTAAANCRRHELALARLPRVHELLSRMRDPDGLTTEECAELAWLARE